MARPKQPISKTADHRAFQGPAVLIDAVAKPSACHHDLKSRIRVMTMTPDQPNNEPKTEGDNPSGTVKAASHTPPKAAKLRLWGASTWYAVLITIVGMVAGSAATAWMLAGGGSVLDLCLAAGAACTAAGVLAHRKFHLPLLRFADDAAAVLRGGQSAAELPIHRTDAVGQIARAISDWALTQNTTNSEDAPLAREDSDRRAIDDRIVTLLEQSHNQLGLEENLDDTTGLGTLGFLRQQLPPMVAACRDSGTPMTFIALTCRLPEIGTAMAADTQRAASIQTHGQTPSSRTLAALLRRSTRASDWLIKLSDNTFGLVMIGAPLERVHYLTYSLRENYRDQAATDDATAPPLSIAVVDLDTHRHADADQLMADVQKTLDQALHRAPAPESTPGSGNSGSGGATVNLSDCPASETMPARRPIGWDIDWDVKVGNAEPGSDLSQAA